MAQIVKFNRAQVLKNVGVQLPSASSQTADVYGKDLTKVTPSAWTYHGNTAEFIGGNPGNSGTYDVANLDKYLKYEVFYFIAMKDHEVKSTLKLTLELPNGMIQENNVEVTVEPHQYQAVSVGQFMNTFSSGNIKFSFAGDTGDTWKGLLIEEVLINRA